MNKEIKKIIAKYRLDKAVCVIAVSGGADSAVLLDLLAQELKPENLIVAHVNHGLRKESSTEAVFVGNLAESYGIRFVEKSLNLTKNDEATARDKRYHWLRSVAGKSEAKYIITAHHLNDQIETTILRIARGVGPLDVWGMKECEEDILRPLLGFAKEEIIAYAKKRNLKWVEDKSNADIRYTRNRIRQNVIPELLKINPSLLKTFKKEIILGQEASDYFTKQIRKTEKGTMVGDKIELSKIKKTSPFVAKEIIRHQLQARLGRVDIYQKNIDEIYGLVYKNGAKETKFRKLTIRKTYKYLTFADIKPKSNTMTKLVLNEWTEFNGFKLRAKVGVAQANKNNILLPLSFSGNLRVRTWRAGDKIEASFGTKKVQDVFVDAKVDAAERLRWPIVTYGNEIIWIPGLVASKYAKKSKKNLIIEVK